MKGFAKLSKKQLESVRGGEDTKPKPITVAPKYGVRPLYGIYPLYGISVMSD